jgi:hypothetical protein
LLFAAAGDVSRKELAMGDFIKDLVREGKLVETKEQPIGMGERFYRRPLSLSERTMYVLPDDKGIAIFLDSGTNRYSYTMILDGEILFEGDGYHPGAMGKTTEQQALEVLAFLALQPGDTDEEFFENYTPAQLAWATSFRCECASGSVRSREEKLCSM